MRGLVAALSLVLLAGVGGCGDDNPVRPIPDDLPRYPFPTSPQNVLQKLVSAYNNRDSVATGAVYDSQYVGTSLDPSLPTPIPAFSRTDEIHHVGRLKLDPSIVVVRLDLGSVSSWQRMPASMSDPADWAIIQISSWSVQVEDIAIATTWHVSNNVMEYTFKPTVAAPGDTTWTIVRWTEIAN